MVTVPHFCPDSPFLKTNPVFLYYEDRFTKPTRFAADIIVSIDDVIDKKLAAVEALPSQFYEGGCNGGPHLVPDPSNKAAVAQRKKEVREAFDKRAEAMRLEDDAQDLLMREINHESKASDDQHV